MADLDELRSLHARIQAANETMARILPAMTRGLAPGETPDALRRTQADWDEYEAARKDRDEAEAAKETIYRDAGRIP